MPGLSKCVIFFDNRAFLAEKRDNYCLLFKLKHLHSSRVVENRY